MKKRSRRGHRFLASHAQSLAVQGIPVKRSIFWSGRNELPISYYSVLTCSYADYMRRYDLVLGKGKMYVNGELLADVKSLEVTFVAEPIHCHGVTGSTTFGDAATTEVNHEVH